MIVSERFKSYSLYSNEEAVNSLAKTLDNLSPEELEAFYTCLTDPEYEQDIHGMELDREIVSVEQWLEDDYYMGQTGKSIWQPWKDDLVELFESDEYSEAVIVGGIGCSTESSLVSTDKGAIPIGDLSSQPHKYLSFDGKGYSYVQGTQSFPKGKGMLYKVSHDEGEFTVTGNHLVMCADHQYRKVETLSPLTPILSASGQQTHEQNGISNVQLVRQKVLDCLGDYLSSRHFCDELLPLVSNICVAFSPLQGDSQKPFLGNKDGHEVVSSFSGAVGSSLFGHHNKQSFFRQLEVQLSDCLGHSYAKISRQSYGFCQLTLQSGTMKDLDHIILKLSAFVRQTYHASYSGSDHREVRQLLSEVDYFFGSSVQQQNLSRHKALQFRSMVLTRLITLLFSALSPRKLQAVSSVEGDQASRYRRLRSAMKYLASEQWQRLKSCRQKVQLSWLKSLGLVRSPCQIFPIGVSLIRSIEKVKTDWYWDLQVPGTNNYVSGGAVHHNSGKSTFSHLATIRMLYEASCLKNPAVSYGLSPNSVIGFCNLAKSKQTARKVVFEGIVEKLTESPYFKYDFAPLKNLKEEILFPKNLAIIAGSSTDTSVIGMNIFGGIFDEGNFMREAAKTSKANMANQKIWGNQSKAGRLFEAVQRRMKSRYMTKGKLPGVLMVVSSKTTHDSFTEQLIRKAQASGSTSTFVRDRNVIEMKRDAFEAETFKVLVGSELYPSKILEDHESNEKYPGGIIIEIPVDFRADFRDNIGDALRDIAGVSTMAISQFMKEPGKIDAMADGREHPFMCALMGDHEQWDSRLPYKIHWEKISKRLESGEWEPKLNPYAKRHVHFDPALTGDAFGLVISHIEGTVPVLQAGTHDIYEQQPVYVVDFVLRIQGEPGEEVLFKAVRQLCYSFSHHGFHLAEFTMDTYQCFTGDTKVRLLDGRNLSMKELTEEYGRDKEFWVYSYDGKRVVPGRGHNARKTGTQRTLIVELDNGEKVRCTYDHLWMLRDGSYRKAKELKPNDSLMPLYSRLSSRNESALEGYEEIYQPTSDTWDFTHRVVGRRFWGKIRGKVIHHAGRCFCGKCRVTSLCKLNNDPDSLQLLTIEEHGKLHSEYGKLNLKDFWDRYKAMPEGSEEKEAYKEKFRMNLQQIRARPDVILKQRAIGKARLAKINEKRWSDADERLKQAKRISIYNENHKDENHPRWRDLDVDDLVKKIMTQGITKTARDLGWNRNSLRSCLRRRGVDTTQFPKLNHKIVSITEGELEDVYDIEVDEHHNFALAAGVFVHNSREMIQALREQGYRAGLYSVDTGIGSMSEDGSETAQDRQMEGAGEGRRKQAYRYLRQAIMDGRVKSYRYPILFEELKRLEDGPVMIDHAENGSKDCADALAGCIWTLFRADYNVKPIAPMLGRSDVPISDDVDIGLTMNENFEPRTVHAGDVIEVPNPNKPLAPREYQKRKGPKTLKPTYRKIGYDGTEEDLTMVPDEIDVENYLSRG